MKDEKLELIALSRNEGSGEPAQIHRLSRDVTVCILKVWMLM